MAGGFFSELVADLWFLAAGVTQLLLVVLGAVVTLQEDWAKRHKKLVVSAFFMLGFAGLIATAKLNRQSATANVKLADSLADLQNATQDITRVTALNTDLQIRLLKQSDTIADLSKQNISTVTGGNSFCYLQFAPLTNERGFATAIQYGKFPLYGIHARIVDLETFDKLHPPGQPLTFENVFLGEVNLDVGDIAVGTATQLSYITFSDSEKERFNIFFSAHNGLSTELLRMRRVNGEWKIAIRVTRMRLGKKGRFEEYSIFEEVDPRYPRQNGVVDW